MTDNEYFEKLLCSTLAKQAKDIQDMYYNIDNNGIPSIICYIAESMQILYKRKVMDKTVTRPVMLSMQSLDRNMRDLMVMYYKHHKIKSSNNVKQTCSKIDSIVLLCKRSRGEYPGYPENGNEMAILAGVLDRKTFNYLYEMVKERNKSK